jgi:hypothetical protein
MTMPPKGQQNPVQVTPANTAAKKKAFLAEIAKGATVTFACQKVGIGRRTIPNWQQRDERFALAYQDARQAKLDKLLEVAFNRALDPKDPRGDILLMFQIKQLDPSFRENAKVEHSLAPGLARSLTQLAKLAEQGD